MFALIAVSAPPLAGFMPAPFVRHLLADVTLTAVAAPLIAAGLAGMLRAVPLPRPLPAAAVGFAMLWLWHVPLLHGLAALSPLVRGIEGLCLLGAGLVLWASALRATAGEPAAGPLALLLTAMHLFLLGTLLTLTWQPLYTADIRTLGDAYAHLAAQGAGGMVLLAGGGIHLAGALWLLGRLLRRPPGPTVVVAQATARPCARIDIAASVLSEEGDLQ
jgi:putative membrane protein